MVISRFLWVLIGVDPGLGSWGPAEGLLENSPGEECLGQWGIDILGPQGIDILH